MLRYTLRQLEYFVATADTGTLTGAAGRHHVSPAGVSLAISELESSLGARLCVRQQSKGVTLTPVGADFLVAARKLLHQARELEVSTTGEGGQLVGTMVLGCYSTLSPFVVPPILAEFAPQHPDLRVDVVEGSSDQLQADMLKGRYDAVIIHERHLIDGVAHEVVQRRVPYVLLPRAWDLAEQDAVAPGELDGRPMVLLDIPSVRDNLLPAIRRTGLDPRIAHRSANFETVRALVGRGMGYSLLMQRPPVDITYEGLPVRPRPFDREVGRSDVVLAFPMGHERSRRVRTLHAFCRSVFPLDGTTAHTPDG